MDLSAEITLKIYVTTAAGYATDTPPNQSFRGVLQSFQFTRSIMQGDIGRFTTGTGNLKINSVDAEYDFLQLCYAIDSRPSPSGSVGPTSPMPKPIRWRRML
ncbi:hypothetical protein RAD16_40030 [Bradyrhizobium sp. 18BD]